MSEFFTHIGSISLSVVIILYILFKIFGVKYIQDKLKSIVDKDIEKYKDALKRESDVLLERVRAEIKIEEIRYSKLREQQAIVFEMFYEKLARTFVAAAQVVSPIEYDDDFDGRVNKVNETFLDFQDYYLTKKIFFPKEICDKTEKFLEGLLKAIKGRHLSKDKRLSSADQLGSWTKAWDLLSGECSQIKIEVENEFRRLMGV